MLQEQRIYQRQTKPRETQADLERNPASSSRSDSTWWPESRQQEA
ncbi:unnamed protein product [Gulo gulo]|uniref:Uncharacterized protein n=1 Tax=Gulo gulo TaxID=48420 RepID=A0A9X9Q6A3_GULGU|nr:unnamed protein product [Gulo gulo]